VPPERFCLFYQTNTQLIHRYIILYIYVYIYTYYSIVHSNFNLSVPYRSVTTERSATLTIPRPRKSSRGLMFSMCRAEVTPNATAWSSIQSSHIKRCRAVAFFSLISRDPWTSSGVIFTVVLGDSCVWDRAAVSGRGGSRHNRLLSAGSSETTTHRIARDFVLEPRDTRFFHYLS